jgi:hypothetical protein
MVPEELAPRRPDVSQLIWNTRYHLSDPHVRHSTRGLHPFHAPENHVACVSAPGTKLARSSRLSLGRRCQRFHQTYSSTLPAHDSSYVRFRKQYSWICFGSRDISRSVRASVRSHNVHDRGRGKRISKGRTKLTGYAKPPLNDSKVWWLTVCCEAP